MKGTWVSTLLISILCLFMQFVERLAHEGCEFTCVFSTRSLVSVVLRMQLFTEFSKVRACESSS